MGRRAHSLLAGLVRAKHHPMAGRACTAMGWCFAPPVVVTDTHASKEAVTSARRMGWHVPIWRRIVS